MCGSGGVAHADDVPSSNTVSLETVQAVANDYAAGNPTAEDEAFVAANPDIAAGIQDGRLTVTGQDASDKAPTTRELALVVSADGDYAAAKKTHCHDADRYLVAESLTHQILYKYHDVVHWCENGSKITSVDFHDYFDNIDGTSEQNPKTGLIHELRKQSASQWLAYVGGSIDNCFLKIGCIGTKYPALQVVHYAGQGNYTYLWFNVDDGSGWHHQ